MLYLERDVLPPQGMEVMVLAEEGEDNVVKMIGITRWI